MAALLLAAAAVWSATKVVDGSVAKVTERGFILMVGTEPLAVDDDSGTRFWRNKASSNREAFAEGDLVTARIRTDGQPVVLRELADRDSWRWLERIRKEPMAGTVERVDDRYLTVKLDTGGSFAYRATDKSDIRVGGKKASSADLKPGQKVYLRGRTLPTYDTWLVQLSDTPITVAKAQSKTPANKSRALVVRLPASGKTTGDVRMHHPALRMFDMVIQGMTFHFGYTAKTVFTAGGGKAGPSALVPDSRAAVTYSRDAFGRMIATKVELISGSVP